MVLLQFAFSLVLATQTANAPQPLTRIDVVVADQTGQRIAGLSAADFEVLENGQKRPIADFVEYSPSGKPAEKVEDPNFVPLITPASPTPARRIVLLVDDATKSKAAAFLAAQLRAGDVITIDDGKGELTSRIAATALRLEHAPEKRAIVVFGEVPEAAKTFAGKRGVAVVTADAAEDLASYYSLAVRPSSSNATLQIRTTRPFAVRTWIASAQPLAEDAAGDAVLAHHFLAPQSNDLQISLSLGGPATAGPKRQVKLLIHVPVRNLSLAKEGDEVTGGFEVLTSIGDGKGRFSRVNRQAHAIRWPAAAAEQAGERDITYSLDVVLEQGASVISVGVVDQRSKKTGFQRIEVSG